MRRVVRALIGVAAGGLAGCVTENPHAAPRPQAPASAVPNRLFLSVGQFPVDSDANGYLDAIDATVYLFDDRNLVSSLRADGTMAFRLATRDGVVIRQWSFAPEEISRLERQFQVGPGYLVRLSLLDGGKDETPAREGDLTASYSPRDAATGSLLRSGDGLRVRIGRASP